MISINKITSSKRAAAAAANKSQAAAMRVILAALLLELTQIHSLADSIEQQQQQQQQLYQRALDGSLMSSIQSQIQQQQQQVHSNSIPGHYEFEVAPKMEPPAVRKPPYQQSAQLCPGSGELTISNVAAAASEC